MSWRHARRIFIAATKQNDGKTSLSLGLYYALQKKFKNIGFIKPVGQRYVIEGGEKVDEDSLLIERTFDVGCSIKDMSPIAVERGFTKNYIMHGGKNDLVKRIKNSFKNIAQDKDLVIIEGTGHAGVGSVFDLSNATVAKLLSSKAIIVSSGGIGRPIDEIVLNKALFERKGVQIAGVIINKIRPEKYDEINHIVRKGLEKKGLRVLGVIPYVELLAEPTIRQIAEELEFEVLGSDDYLDSKVGKSIVCAMKPPNALKYMADRNLIIVPGDRDDMILAVATFQIAREKEGDRITGIVLTGGIKPHQSLITMINRVNIPLLLAGGDTYNVTSKIKDLIVKIKPEDEEKTNIVKNMIEEHVDIDLLLKQL